MTAKYSYRFTRKAECLKIENNNKFGCITIHTSTHITWQLYPKKPDIGISIDMHTKGAN